MTDEPKDPKDNVVDFSRAKSSNSKKDSTEGGGTEGDNLNYAVQPVIMVEEGERLIRLKYMTESGYLDILGVLNQIQLHNKARFRTVGIMAVVGWILACTGILLTVISLW